MRVKGWIIGGVADEGRFLAPFARLDGAHHPRRAGANNEDVKILHAGILTGSPRILRGFWEFARDPGS